MLSTFLSLSFAGVQLYSTRVFSFRPSTWTSSTMKSSGASLRVLQGYVDGNSRHDKLLLATLTRCSDARMLYRCFRTIEGEEIVRFHVPLLLEALPDDQVLSVLTAHLVLLGSGYITDSSGTIV